MSLNEIPTPLTDLKAERRIVMGKPRDIVDADIVRDLERKLAACRTTLESITHDMGASQQIHNLCAETLELTKP